LQGRRTWLQLLCVTLACTRCSSTAFSSSCDAIRIGLPPPRAECFCSILADVLVQFSPDLRLRLAVPHSPLLPPREPKPAHTGAISISSVSNPQCRLISSAAFPLTASDVLHGRLCCSLGGSACSRRIATPLASRAISLHIVILHAVELLLRFLLPNPCSPGLAASLPRSHTRFSAARATCPPAAQRLHSNALRAARSRTRRHVALHQLPYATARTLAPHLRSACAYESMLQRHPNCPRAGSFPRASTPARTPGPVRAVCSCPAPALPAHAPRTFLPSSTPAASATPEPSLLCSPPCASSGRLFLLWHCPHRPHADPLGPPARHLLRARLQSCSRTAGMPPARPA
jgi:hypothetical protein